MLIKPRCRLIGEDGNAFAIIGRVTTALRKAGQKDKVDAFMKEATSGDYDHLLATCLEYVDDESMEDDDSGDVA